jgi:hypothetical protein
VVNRDDSGGDTFAQFGYDYSADGIPEAPSSPGSSAPTRGLKFRVNENFTFVNGVSASPLNKSFTGDYRLRFDMWINYAGPLGGGGVGTTEHLSAGVGTSGTQAVWPLGNSDCVWFTVSGDGDVVDTNVDTADYGVFVLWQLQPADSGVYAAGTTATARGNLHPYYSLWGGVQAPPAQLTLRPTQTGTTPVGSMGMAWHCVTITRQGTNVTWDIDGRRIATVNISDVTLGENIFVGYHDWFPSIGTNTVVQFGLVDNVRVEDLVPVTPTTIAITTIRVIGGNVEIDFTAGAADVPGNFGVQSAGTVNGPYGNVTATITQQGTGLFRAARPVDGTQHFYRIRRL